MTAEELRELVEQVRARPTELWRGYSEPLQVPILSWVPLAAPW
jgi:hypothetical protein